MMFSTKVDWGSCIISVAKTASKEIGALICLMPFLSPEAALYLFKSIIQPCMNTIHPSLAVSLEPLANNRNVASLSLFYRYHFGQCSSELTQQVPPPYSRGGSTRFSDRLNSFSVTIPICYKDVSGNSFLPRKARLWNSLAIECFPLTYDQIGLQSRINRHLLTGSFIWCFLNRYLLSFNLFVQLFLLTPCLVFFWKKLNASLKGPFLKRFFFS